MPFQVTAVTLPAWGLLAVALGALAGAVLRRTAPAMAAAGAAMIALAIGVYRFVPTAILSAGASARRAAPFVYYLYSDSSSSPVAYDPAGQPYGHGGLVIGHWFTGPGGGRLSPAMTSALLRQIWRQMLLNPEPSRPANVAGWLAARHYAYWIGYQPAGQYWTFQLIEAGGLVLLAAVLAAAALLLIRRS